jgi:glycosyltransferase involved in cell wall biosynthesis
MTEQIKLAIYGCNEGPEGFGHVIINLINALGQHYSGLFVMTHNETIVDYDKIDATIRRVVLGRAKSELGSAIKLANYLKQELPDIVLCDGNREKNCRILLLAKWLARSRAKIVFRLGTPHSRIAAQRNGLNAFFYRLSVKKTFACADFVIANSRGVADDLVQMTGLATERIQVVENSTISPSLYVMAGENLSDPWFEDPAHPVVIGIGRLRKAKNFELLIKAFAIVRRQRSCRLAILGEGAERPHLESLIKELNLEGSVKLYGHVRNPFAYLQRAALFVLSSRFEGSPNVLIEALALGVPAVATDCHSGPREILGAGVHGSLVPVGDSERMAAAMLATLAKPLPGESLRDAVAAKYNVDTVTEQYVDIFQSLLCG